MKYRPYSRFSPEYDAFYLRLANRVFEVINQEQRVFRSLLQRDQLVELAVVLASWFEDYANEIGLWSTFVRKNKDLYGYYLPFFDLREYDPEEINPQDLAYLLWHYCNQAANKLIAPDSPGLTECAEILSDILDDALDEAPGTEFYDQFLNVPEDVYFFDLKAKLHWMAFRNYLVGPEFNRTLKNEIEAIQAEDPDFFSSFGDPGKVVYGMQDDFHYKRSSSFLACTATSLITNTKCRLRSSSKMNITIHCSAPPLSVIPNLHFNFTDMVPRLVTDDLLSLLQRYLLCFGRHHRDGH